jgi:hypothetical protein
VIEYQWGVRTVYADGSGGTEWSNEDEARSFLASYSDYDAEPGMRVRSRELVRREILPGAVEVVDCDYAERRRRADERVKQRRARRSPGEPVTAGGG